jgi:hypothetical protein
MNALEWLRADELSEWRGHAAPGEPLHFRLGKSETFVEVQGPDGSTEKLQGKPGEEVSFMRTDGPGLYAIKRAGGQEWAAVNLMDPVESSGRVAEKLKLGDESVRAQAAPPPSRQDSWKYFAWAAIVVMLLEWWVYHRRIDIF